MLGDILVNLFLAVQENVREGDNPPVGLAHGPSFVLFDDATDVVFAWGLRHHFYGPSISLLGPLHDHVGIDPTGGPELAAFLQHPVLSLLECCFSGLFIVDEFHHLFPTTHNALFFLSLSIF